MRENDNEDLVRGGDRNEGIATLGATGLPRYDKLSYAILDGNQASFSRKSPSGKHQFVVETHRVGTQCWAASATLFVMWRSHSLICMSFKTAHEFQNPSCMTISGPVSVLVRARIAVGQTAFFRIDASKMQNKAKQQRCKAWHIRGEEPNFRHGSSLPAHESGDCA